MLFPPHLTRVTGLDLREDGDGLPLVHWTGLVPEDRFGDEDGGDGGPGTPLLGEHAYTRFTRPHLRGHRVGGGAWTTWFRVTEQSVDDRRLALLAVDPTAGLEQLYELEAVVSGILRGRATVTNSAAGDYVELVFSLPGDRRSFRVRGNVVFLDQAPPSGLKRPGFGARFERPPVTLLDAIRNLHREH